jgi:hypothetical protein
MSAPPLDLPLCEALAARSADGDGDAWRALVAHLWPFWQHAVRTSRALGPLARSEDTVHDVVAALVEKLGPEAGAALGLYPAWRAANPDRTFEDWIRIITAYAVRDYVRRALGRGKTKDPELPSPKRLLNELATSPLADDPALAVRPSMTMAQTARQLLAWAEGRLAKDQLRALMMWMEGAEVDEIGEEMCAGDAEAARKLMRAAVAVLRRHFAGKDG